MDRRAWPWKKKPFDKLSFPADPADSCQTFGSKQEDQENGDKVKALSEQLSTALYDLAAKEELVKQHAKVAEEAVTGWEKTEAEVVALRQKLDDALQQKLAAEDRVLHLDGALKECMKQLRHVREEQEQIIHDTVMKKTREWEKAHTELNLKLTDFGSQLVEARAESNAMSKSLQERERIIAEISEVKALADAEINVLQVKLNTMERENAKVKYEAHVLNKELDIRTEERECNIRVVEAANKQHLENVKKIAKLETECHRLRLLVKRRLPGQGALAQMRLEVEVLGRENGERPRKCCKSGNPSVLPSESINDSLTRAPDAVSDRIVAMEDETNSLKKVLTKKNNELQAARLMCVHTASKLSTVEERFENLSRVHRLSKLTDRSLPPLGSSKETSTGSVSDDGAMQDEGSGAEPWASVLMTELACIKKEKLAGYSTLDLMNDFTEMEKLASFSEKITEIHGNPGKIVETPYVSSVVNETENTEKSIRLCNELRSNLEHLEEQVSMLRERECKSEAIIACLKQKLASIFKAQMEGMGMNKMLEEAKCMLEQMDDSFQGCFSNMISGIRTRLPGSPSCQSQESNVKEVTHISTVADVKGWDAGRELADAVHKVLDLIEGLDQSDYSVPFPHLLAEYATESVSFSGDQRWKNFEYESSIQGLITLCQTFLQGKVDIIDFMAEIASALDWLVGYIFSAQASIRKGSGSGAHSDCDVATSANNIVSHQHKASNFDASHEEIQTLLLEKEALQTRLESQNSRLVSLESELSRLKLEKDEINQEYKLAKQLLENSKSRLQESEHQMVDVKAQLAIALEKKEALERNSMDLLHGKELAESELLSAKDDFNQLQTKAEALQAKLLEQTGSCLEVENKLAELQQQQLARSRSTEKKSESKDSGLSTDEELRLQKEQEIASAAEKLAECQRSILVLGKQLKALGAPKAMADECFSSSIGLKPVNQLLCAAGHMHYTHEPSDAPYHASIGHLKASPVYGWSRKKCDRVAECGSSLGVDAPFLRGQMGMMNHTNSCKGGSWGSPVHGDAHPGAGFIQSAPLGHVVASPGCSPARFLSLKHKASGGQDTTCGGPASSSEKHGSGIARLFLRSKNGSGH